MDTVIKNVALLYTAGCPDITSRQAIRSYMRQFLSDRNVIRLNPLLWRTILALMILPRRPAAIQARYRQIAIDGHNPLRHYLESLTRRLNERSDTIIFRQVCTYTPPTIEQALQDLEVTELKNVIVLPLYPQHTEITHRSCFEQADRCLSAMGFDHRTIQVHSYCRNPCYLEAITRSIIREASPQQDLIISFHSMRTDYIRDGDVYQEECELTFAALRSRLAEAGWDESRVHLTYHSPFGRRMWLKPRLEEVAAQLARSGVRELAVCAPGFPLDCLETLYDIAIACRQVFIEQGGRELTVVSCLNDSDDQVELLHGIADQIVTSITLAKQGHEHDRGHEHA